MDEHLVPQIGPDSSLEDLARVYGTLAAGYYQKIPQIVAAVERIEAAVLVASGAAHRAETSSQRVQKSVAVFLEEVKKVQDIARVLEMRVGGAESVADEARKTGHDLERFMAETGRILAEREKDPDDKEMTSDRVRAIAERARADAVKEEKADAYDEILKTKKKSRERWKEILPKAVGAALIAIGTAAGAALWGQCQRTAGRLEGMQSVKTAPATTSPPVVPLPFEPPTNPSSPRALLDAGMGR